MLDSSKLKEFADDNFKFDENGRKLSKRVENTVGKGEIARHEQFLLFPQCFQKACFPGASKGIIVWEWVKQRHQMQSRGSGHGWTKFSIENEKMAFCGPLSQLRKREFSTKKKKPKKICQKAPDSFKIIFKIFPREHAPDTPSIICDCVARINGCSKIKFPSNGPVIIHPFPNGKF